MNKEQLLQMLLELGIDPRMAMTRGSAHIPELKLEVLQNFVTSFMSSPNLKIMNMFPASNSPSSAVKWESQRGGRGLMPFVAPGAPAPVTAPFGFAQHSAEAAYWKEKMPFDEEFLNNLRLPGTESRHMEATQKLATELGNLVNRADRRKEWMFCQMLAGNGFTYSVKGGYKVTVDYGIPSGNRPTLAAAYNWYNGASKNIIKDIRDGKKKVSTECGGKIDTAIFNSTVLSYLADDTTIRQLLQKNYYGDGALFGSGSDIGSWVEANAGVIGRLLDIPNFIVYDEMYEVRAWLTGAVTGTTTTWLSVDDTSDFAVGEVLRIHDQSAGTYEEAYIYSINTENSTIQINHPYASSYKAGEDFVTMAKYFIPDDKFIMLASRVDGKAIAEYKRAPFGVERRWGRYTDKHDEWDPEVTWIRCQDKGLPVLFQRDAIYVIDVKITTGQAATTTTTTSSSSTSTTN